MNYSSDMTTYVATVTAAPDAKLHFDVKGRAHCGAGTGITRLEGNAALEELNSIDRLCKRCLARIRAALKVEIAQAAGGGQSHTGRTAILVALRNLQRMLQTSAEYRASIEFADKLRAQHTAPPAPVARPNAWAQMRDSFAAANARELIAA